MGGWVGRWMNTDKGLQTDRRMDGQTHRQTNGGRDGGKGNKE